VHDDHHSSVRSQRLDYRGRCRIRAVTLRDNNHPMQQKAGRDLRRSASDLNSSPMRTSRVSASRAEPADRALLSRTIPIAAKPRIASRAFVQSGFNEVASQAPAAPSRERDLTEPSRFSPSESKLAVSLADGKPLRMAAAANDIKFTTARAYLEQIFRKTGTNKQSQLVALLKSANIVRSPQT
jgi:DNA-binding NarL/FixJ family response regulator